ncbi:hypothetical protein NC652_002361 [Populus alba x Populus x berolinensis]|nr:hypothetical protein NC651_002279 [Populus alba x Populus x berolinensis]KAJ6964054.1 hypothetical protein NC652_002361 [Populus alba x Populus x berolinensis]
METKKQYSLSHQRCLFSPPSSYYYLAPR